MCVSVCNSLTADAAECWGAPLTFTAPTAMDPSLVSTKGTLRGEEDLGVTKDPKEKQRRAKARHLLLQR